MQTAFHKNMDPQTAALAVAIERHHDAGFTWAESEDLARDELNLPPLHDPKPMPYDGKPDPYDTKPDPMIKLLQKTVDEQRALLDRIYEEVRWAQDHKVRCVNVNTLRWILEDRLGG